MSHILHFCARSGGNNLNTGTYSGTMTEPELTAAFTYLNGTWDQTNSVFTAATEDPSGDGVEVGTFAALASGSDTEAYYIGKVIGASATTITLSPTASIGTNPADGTLDLRIGGAWSGPSGNIAFPFDIMSDRFHTDNENIIHVNLKNNKQYPISGTIGINSNGPVIWNGYTNSYLDGGKTTFYGGTGLSKPMFVVSGDYHSFFDLDFYKPSTIQADSVSGLLYLQGNSSLIWRCIFHDYSGNGLNSAAASNHIIECETYNCGIGGAAFNAGFVGNGMFEGCISHHNRNFGFSIFSGGAVRCIAANNRFAGYSLKGKASTIVSCDSYKNSNGVVIYGNPWVGLIEFCNFFDHNFWAVASNSEDVGHGIIRDIAYNVAQKTGVQYPENFLIYNETVYNSGYHPWVAPDSGNFTLRSEAGVRGLGVRHFLSNSGIAYSGTVAYYDLGATQSFAPKASGGFYHYALGQIMSGIIDMDSDTLKVMLVTPSYIFNPDHTGINPGMSGNHSLLHNELQATNYSTGFNQAGRKTATISVQTNSGDNTVDIGINELTWSSLGGVVSDEIGGAVLIKENTNDFDSVPIVFFDLTNTITNGNDVVLQFSTIGNGGNVRFYV